MKGPLCLSASVLLLFTLTAGAATEMITVKKLYDSIELSCPEGWNFKDIENGKRVLQYKDNQSEEYKCEKGDESASIYVKFRTCDNCIELDTVSMVGMVIGDVVATCVVAVAVYLFASVIQGVPVTSVNKSSSRQLPSPRGASNDPYQALKFNSPKDEYDKLGTKR